MPSKERRAISVAEDPVTAADFFHFSIQCIFRDLFGWDFPSRKIFHRWWYFGGNWMRFTELQSTRSVAVLHGHFEIWLKGGLNPSQVHEKMRGKQRIPGPIFFLL